MVNWADVLITVVILYSLLKLEQAYRVWRWKRSRGKLPSLRPDAETKGFVDGAAEAVPCGRCGVMTKKYFAYADGDHWCKNCDEAEV